MPEEIMDAELVEAEAEDNGVLEVERFELDFDIIKIDKSILWAAQKEGTGKAILENSARMILQIGKKILVEGVETKDQIEMLRPLTVDYLQGYYFSKPLPKTEFIELLQAA